jgi:hypothetical protein
MSLSETIKRLFRREVSAVEEVAEGGEPVATPPPGAIGDSDRETSTNAQTQGAADQPWSGTE